LCGRIDNYRSDRRFLPIVGKQMSIVVQHGAHIREWCCLTDEIFVLVVFVMNVLKQNVTCEDT